MNYQETLNEMCESCNYREGKFCDKYEERIEEAQLKCYTESNDLF